MTNCPIRIGHRIDKKEAMGSAASFVNISIRPRPGGIESSSTSWWCDVQIHPNQIRKRVPTR